MDQPLAKKMIVDLNGIDKQLDDFVAKFRAAYKEIDAIAEKSNEKLLAQKKFNSDYKEAKAGYEQDIKEYQAYLDREKAIADEFRAQQKRGFQAQYDQAKREYESDEKAYAAYLAREKKIAEDAESAKQADLKKVSSQYYKQLDKDYKAYINGMAKDTAAFNQQIQSNTEHMASGVQMALQTVTRFIWNQLGQAFRDAVDYVKEFDEQINQIGMVINDYGQAKKLGDEYEQLAKTLKVNSVDIAKAAQEVYRQGVTDAEEVEGRLVAITKYAKVSGLTFNSSVDIMTAALNNFKGPTEDATDAMERISDVWSYLGDATATGKHICPAA